MKYSYIFIVLMLIIFINGCSISKQSTETFVWPEKTARYEMKAGDKVIKIQEYRRNFFINIVHDEDILLKQEISEEYIFDDDMEDALQRTKNNFELIEENESLKHKGVSFDYIVDDKYFKVTITINYNYIREDNVEGLLLNYIGEGTFGENGLASYEQLSKTLFDLGFIHSK